MRWKWYFIIGAALGLTVFAWLPFVTGLPVFLLTHSGRSDLLRLGDRLSDILAPGYELWEGAMACSYAVAGMLEGKENPDSVIGTIVVFTIPALAGGLLGVAWWGACRLKRSCRRHRRLRTGRSRPNEPTGDCDGSDGQ